MPLTSKSAEQQPQRHAVAEHTPAAGAAASLIDNRPQALLQRQLIATAEHGPRAVTQRARSAQIQDSPRVAQRMVVLNKPAMTGNFVELTSIDYALKRGGPPFALFGASDFSGLGPGDSLYFVAHGSVGKSGTVTANALIARLLDPKLGLKNSIREIVFTSCYAGKGDQPDDGDSVVSQLRDALHKMFPGITIVGARGPSVKSDQTGNDFTVWDTSKTVDLPAGLGTKRAVTVMETLFTVYYGPDFLTKYAIDRMNGASVADKAETASEETGHFYEEFQDSIKDPPGSITLNQIKAGTWQLNPSEYVDISDRLELVRTLTHAELLLAIAAIQAHATLALPNPMAVESS